MTKKRRCFILDFTKRCESYSASSAHKAQKMRRNNCSKCHSNLFTNSSITTWGVRKIRSGIHSRKASLLHSSDNTAIIPNKNLFSPHSAHYNAGKIAVLYENANKYNLANCAVALRCHFTSWPYLALAPPKQSFQTKHTAESCCLIWDHIRCFCQLFIL